ncbi:hypothetical protein [Hyalangium rubrum]|uniref:Glucosyltransferase-I n=1 Tax=Hyalangium rubrum TaxID=3103134 RepID=A0ABU5H896_9BACT|nr:hypothetical protein [Hyalangium sp. s54d21]MDY7229329.1 hypothetical protein [Hyalangium sp. s54d21]
MEPGSDTPPAETEDTSPPPRSETCTPVSCEDRGANCGTLPDGCGGTLNCGGCADGQSCGLHQPNVCGTQACAPRTCQEAGAFCGAIEDGCGGTIQCGTCGAGMTCGGGGKDHQCGTPNYGTDTACSSDGVCFLNPLPVSHDFKDVWGRSVDDFWGVGNAGYIIHGGKSGLTVLPSKAELSGIWGSAGEDVWAVGSEILHFDGRRWNTAARPERFLLDVHGTGAGNVWTVGEGGLAYAWNGARWERQNTGTSADLYGVWTHGDEVWAVGTGATIRVRDAKGWRGLDAPARDVTFTAVWGTGPRDVWVTGDRSGTVLFHWDGQAWSSVQLAFSALYGISGKSSGNVLVVGEEGAAQYNGGRWTTTLGGTPTRLLGAWHMADGVVVVGAGGRVHRFRDGSSGVSLDQGARADFVSLSATEDGRWWFADGSGVRTGLPPSEFATQGPGNALTLHVPGRLWAAGNFGRVNLHSWSATINGTNHFYMPQSFNFHGVYPILDMLAWVVGTDTATGEGVLIQLDGHTSWTRYPLTAPGALNAIHGATNDDVWAVGESVILHWDGTAWTETRGPWLPAFRAVHAVGRDLAWALSPHSLWRWDGMQWAPITLPTGLETLELRALFADSRDTLYVAGDGGLLLRYDVARNAWRRIDTGTRKSLRALSGGPRTLIVAGEDGTVLRLYR